VVLTGQRKKSAMFVSVAAQHKEGLKILMETLGATYPHFIRCIIPNYEKRPGKLVPSIVLEQLRCNGVLEGIKITRKGFPNRIIYPEFVKRYYILVKGITRTPPDPRGATETILDALKIDKESYRFGLTKIFFRTGVLAYIEEVREQTVGKMIVSIQICSRAFLARRIYKKVKTRSKAGRIIGTNVKEYLDFKAWKWWALFQKVKPLLQRVPHEQRIEELEKQIRDLDASVQKETKLRETLNNQLTGLLSNEADLKKQLEEEKRLCGELEHETSKLEQVKGDLERKISGLEDEVKQTDISVRELQNNKKALDSKADQLQSQLEEQIAAKANLEKLKKQLEGDLYQLKMDYDKSTDSISRLEKGKVSLEQEVSNLRDQIASNEDQQSNLDKAKKSLYNDLEDLRHQLEEQKSKAENTDKAKKKLEVDLKEKLAELDRERQNNSILDGNKKKLESELEDNRTQLTNAQKSVVELQKEKKRLQEQLDVIKEYMDDTQENKSLLDAVVKKSPK